MGASSFRIHQQQRKRYVSIFSNEFTYLSLLLYFSIINFVFYLISLRSGGSGVGASLFGGGDDGLFYYEQATRAIRGDSWSNLNGYPSFMYLVFTVTKSTSPLIIRTMHLVASIFLFFTMKRLVILLLDDSSFEEEKLNMYLLGMFIFYFSLSISMFESLYRDVYIYLLFILSLYMFLSINKLINQDNYSSMQLFLRIIALILSLVILYSLRVHASLSIIIGTVMFFLAKKIRKIDRRYLILSMIFVLTLAYIIYNKYMSFPFPFFGWSIENVLNYRNYFVLEVPGGSQFNIVYPYSNFFVFLARIIESYANHLWGPLPGFIFTKSMLFMFIVEGIPLLYMSVYLARHKQMLATYNYYTLLNGALYLFFIAFTNDNAGAMSRLRVAYAMVVFANFISIMLKYYNREGEGRYA